MFQCFRCYKKFEDNDDVMDGFLQWKVCGWSSVSDPHEPMSLCPKCMIIFRRFVGLHTMEDCMGRPSALYTFGKKGFGSKPSSMMIHGKHIKYNKNKLVKAQKQHDELMNEKYPLSVKVKSFNEMVNKWDKKYWSRNDRSRSSRTK